MPADDLILNVKQIDGYPATASAMPSDAIVLQRGGLGGPYLSISPALFVGSALAQGGDMAIGGLLQVQSVSTGKLTASNGAFGYLSAQKACLTEADFQWASLKGVPLADQEWVTNLIAGVRASSVWSVNGRTGDIKLSIWDVEGAAPIFSPRFMGSPVAPTPAPRSCSDRIATTAFAQRLVIEQIDHCLKDNDFVFSFNGRTGVVVLTNEDVIAAGAISSFNAALTGVPTAPTAAPLTNSSQIATTQYVDAAVAAANYASLDSPIFTGVPTVPTALPGSSTGQIASTAFVMNAITAATAGVATFNGRTGAVVLDSADLTEAGGALLISPAFQGTPSGPTAAAGTSSTQLATCAFVMNELGGLTSGVTTFNGRAGVVTLTLADVIAAGGAPSASPTFTGTPTAPTAPTGVNSNQIATTAYVLAAIANSPTGVSSFNGRTGDITLTANDVSAVGALLNPSAALTGTPTAPTAAQGVNSNQIATTAFVVAALAGFGGGVYLPLNGGALTGPLTGTFSTFGANLTSANTQSVTTVNMTAVGSGVNGPATAQLGSTINAYKNNWNLPSAAVGEIDGLVINQRNGGIGSDGGALLLNVAGTGTGHRALWEGVIEHLDVSTLAVDYEIIAGMGVVDTVSGFYIGLNLELATGDLPDGTQYNCAIVTQASPGASWGDAYQNIAPDGLNFRIDAGGSLFASVVYPDYFDASDFSLLADGSSRVINFADGFGLGYNTSNFNYYLSSGGNIVWTLNAQTGAMTVSGSGSFTGALAATTGNFSGAVATTGVNFGTGTFAFAWASPAMSAFVGGVSVGNVILSTGTSDITALSNIVLSGATSTMIATYAGGQAAWDISLSDRRLKTNIVDAGDALGALAAIPVHAFDMTNPFPGAQPQHWTFGVIADEVKPIVPQAVIEMLGGDGYASIRELPLIAALIKAVQQLASRMAALETRMA